VQGAFLLAVYKGASSEARKMEKVPRACPWGFHIIYYSN